MALAAAAEERWLDAVAAGARAAGLQLETIIPAGELGSAALELLSQEERARKRRAERVSLKRLATATVLLWLTVIGVVLGRWMRESYRVERELARLSAPAKAVIAARQRMDEAVRTIETVAETERARHAVATRLAAIVGALPDSSYLTSLALDTIGNGSMTGAAKHAAQVVAALERSGAVEGARLVGPTVREVAARREWERFTVGFGPSGGR